MRWSSLKVAVAVFVLATVSCAVAAAGLRTTGGAVRAHAGDSVLYTVPRETASCSIGQVAAGKVIATSGARVRIAGALTPHLFVNGVAVATLPRLGTQSVSRFTVPPRTVFLLGAPKCDSRSLGVLPTRSIIGFTEAGMKARVAVVQHELDDRITAEKYVAAVYLLFVAAFFGYLLIHAAKFSRLEQEVSVLVLQQQKQPLRTDPV